MAGSFEQAPSDSEDEDDEEEEEDEDVIIESDEEDNCFAAREILRRQPRELTSAERERLALLACGDGPIIEDYDPVTSVQERVGSPEDQRRQDLQAEIKMKLRQASQLWHRIEHAQDDGKETEIMKHYGQVCAKILLEVSGLRAELHSLPGNRDSETIPIPEFEATFMQMIMKTFLLYVEEQVKKEQPPDQGSEGLNSGMPKTRDELCTTVVHEWLYCELSPKHMEAKVPVGEGWSLLVVMGLS
jgi:hypothetical protein